jgi:nucleoside-triphosphatase
VEPDRLVPLIEEELVRPAGAVDVFLIDEIGKMECNCPQFISTMKRLLGGPTPVVATIALRAGGFIAEIKARSDVQVLEVTNRNRDALPAQIAAWAKEHKAQAPA